MVPASGSNASTRWSAGAGPWTDNEVAAAESSELHNPFPEYGPNMHLMSGGQIDWYGAFRGRSATKPAVTHDGALRLALGGRVTLLRDADVEELAAPWDGNVAARGARPSEAGDAEVALEQPLSWKVRPGIPVPPRGVPSGAP